MAAVDRIPGPALVERPIIAFHQDDEGQWVAELQCGHTQHVRHDPPWQVRPWVTDSVERQRRIGTTLECGRCGEGSR